jgi:hypothetical protein
MHMHGGGVGGSGFVGLNLFLSCICSGVLCKLVKDVLGTRALSG